MPTLSVIEGRVRANVEDLPTATADRVQEMIQLGQQRMEEKFTYRVMKVETVPIATVEDSRTLGTTANYVRWLRRLKTPYYQTGDGDTIEMDWLESRRQIVTEYSELNATEKGAPRNLYEMIDPVTGAVTLDIYPFPDNNNSSGTVYTDGNYRIVVPFIQRLPDLTDSVQNNFFTNDPPSAEFLENYASARLLFFNRDYENANTFFGLATDALSRSIRADRRRQVGDLQIRPRTAVFGSRLQVRAGHGI